MAVKSAPAHLRCLPSRVNPSEEHSFLRPFLDGKSINEDIAAVSLRSARRRLLPSSLPLLGHSLLSCFRTALSEIFSISSREGGSNVMEFLSRSLCGSRVVCKFHEPSRHSLISLHVFVEKFTWIEVGCLLMAG